MTKTFVSTAIALLAGTLLIACLQFVVTPVRRSEATPSTQVEAIG